MSDWNRKNIKFLFFLSIFALFTWSIIVSNQMIDNIENRISVGELECIERNHQSKNEVYTSLPIIRVENEKGEFIGVIHT